MDTIKVTKTFVSLQGEGPNAGIPMFFIRLAQYNLECRWCDTKESWSEGKEISVLDLTLQAEKSGKDYICITGGEPLLQFNLAYLVRQLHNDYRYIEIETNGTQVVPSWRKCVDAFVVDYKLPSSGNLDYKFYPQWYKEADLIKFVINDQVDLNVTLNVLDSHPEIKPKAAFSTVWNCDRELRRLVIRTCIERDVRYNMQQHKYLDIE